MCQTSNAVGDFLLTAAAAAFVVLHLNIFYGPYGLCQLVFDEVCRHKK